MAIFGMRRYLQGFPTESGPFLLCELVFGVVGAGLLLRVFVVAKRRQETIQLQEQFLNDPWMWDERWASGGIEGSTKGGMVPLWILAILCTALCLPATLAIAGELEKGNKAILFVLAFVLVAVGLWIWAIRAAASASAAGLARKSSSAARHPEVAIVTTVFSVLWLVALGAMLRFGAPIVFPIFFGVFAVLLMGGVVELWMRVSRGVVEASLVRVPSGLLAASERFKTIAASDVADIRTKLGLQMGSKPYDRIEVLTKDGERTSLGDYVRDKTEAEWLIQEMKQVLERSGRKG